MKNILVLALLMACASFTAKAQSFEVPKNYILEAKTDYPKYEQDIIKTIDWLQATPWGEQEAKRKEANAFFVKWISGSPDVNVEIGQEQMKYWDKNPDLMITYMGGSAKYGILHKQDFDKSQSIAAGLQAVLEKYKSEKNHKKDSDLEKLLKN